MIPVKLRLYIKYHETFFSLRLSINQKSFKSCKQITTYHRSIADTDLFPNCWWISSHADKHQKQDRNDDGKHSEQTDTNQQAVVIALPELHAHNTTDENLKLYLTMAEITKTEKKIF